MLIEISTNGGIAMSVRMTRVGTRLDAVLDSLANELTRLKRETDMLTEGFRNEEIVSMQSGELRDGADENEEKARRKFKRMREIEQLLNTHHGN